METSPSPPLLQPLLKTQLLLLIYILGFGQNVQWLESQQFENHSWKACFSALNEFDFYRIVWRDGVSKEDSMMGTTDPKEDLHCHKHVIKYIWKEQRIYFS